METDASVLVVDDQPALLDLMQLTLESTGYQVLTAREGAEALTVLESHPVDVIIADISMPRMNGYQLYERIVSHPAWVTIPFIFLTALGLDSDIRYGKELGVDDYLTKPIEPEDLLAVVRGKLRRSRHVASSSQPAPPRPATNAKVIDLGRLRIDSGQYRVWLDGQQIKLSLKEFRLLEGLACQPAKVIPFQQLIQDTHDLKTDRTDASALLRPLVRSLRRKLGYPAGDMGCIESVRGIGYRLTLQRE
jgi:DNA-binding response OmpR family regulator